MCRHSPSTRLRARYYLAWLGLAETLIQISAWESERERVRIWGERERERKPLPILGKNLQTRAESCFQLVSILLNLPHLHPPAHPTLWVAELGGSRPEFWVPPYLTDVEPQVHQPLFAPRSVCPPLYQADCRAVVDLFPG